MNHDMSFFYVTLASMVIPQGIIIILKSLILTEYFIAINNIKHKHYDDTDVTLLIYYYL